MPMLRRLLNDARASEERAIDASQFPFGMFPEQNAASGVVVDQDTAMTFGAVYACIRLISDSMASLPWDVFLADGAKRTLAKPPTWVDRPNPECSAFEFKQRIQASLESDGNAFIAITAFDSLAYPSELWVLHPSDIEPKRDDNGRKYFLFNGTEVLEPWNPARPALGQVLHIKGFATDNLKGLSPIDLAREAIGLGLVTERFGAGFFGKGQNPSGIIELPATANPTKEFKQNLKETWNRTQGGVSKSHLPAVLTGGATWKPITISPENAQFLETRKHQVTEIARWFGVPPHFIGDVEKSSSWGTGIEQQSIGFVVYSLTPRIVRVEQALGSLLRGNQYLKLNVRGLLRGDQKARYEAYSIGKQNGFLSTDDIRSFEDLNPVPGGEEYVQQLNLAPIGQEATFKERIEAVGALVRAGFDPTEALLAVGLDPIKHLGTLPVTVQSDDSAPKPGATP